MFDDSVIKNNDNPTVSQDYTNKLTWSSTSKSNVTSLGVKDNKNNTGLFAFNPSVKNAINYVYLNNNKFFDVDALIDFKNIVELQLQCNSNLSNVNGLENHDKLSILTLHSCSLNSIGFYNGDRNEYYGGISGCSALSKLSVQRNSSLSSLIGIEGSENLEYLIANNCDIRNVDSLKNHKLISYLNLASNINLESVKYIQHCKALQYIYLDNNLKMNSSEMNIAFNGIDETYGNDIIIKKCVNGYENIPRIYWSLFQKTANVIDYSYSTLGKYLTEDSSEWIDLYGRTDITKLNLNGQKELPMQDLNEGGSIKHGINTTLSKMKEMRALALNNCTQIDSIDFVKNMVSLYELDIRGVSSKLIDVSVLNDLEYLNRLIVNNPLINAEGIQDLINRFKYEHLSDMSCTWYTRRGWQCSGYVAEDDNFPDFSNCSRIISFLGGNMSFDSNENGTLNLWGTNVKTYTYTRNCPYVTKLPVSCAEACIDQASDATLEFESDYSGKITGNHIIQKTIDNLVNSRIINGIFSPNELDGDVIFPQFMIEKFMHISIKGQTKYSVSFENFLKAGLLEELDLSDMKNILNAEKIGNLHNLNYLGLKNCNLNDISWISTLINLKYLDLSNNNISDISPLRYLEKIDKRIPSEDDIIQYDFILSNNNITDITPLADAIGNDGVINYKSLDISNNSLDGYTVVNNIEVLLKLHNAGLEKVIITGNNFTANEINSLKDGTTINGVSYEGFGSENVIN